MRIPISYFESESVISVIYINIDRCLTKLSLCFYILNWKLLLVSATKYNQSEHTGIAGLWTQSECFCDNWKSSLLSLLLFNWRTFSRRVQHVGDVSEQTFKYGPIRTRKIGGVWLSEALDWRWTLDAGLWTLDSGHWMLDSERWTLDAWLCTLDSWLWTLFAWLWTLDSRPWTQHFGHWDLDTGYCHCLFQNRIRTQFLILLD